MENILFKGLKQRKPQKPPKKSTNYKIIGEELDHLKSFSSLNVDCIFDEPTLVQQIVIPYMLAKHNICVQSFTGSRKTLSFVLPILELSRNERVGCVILVPYDQLVTQIYNVVTEIAGTVCVVGSITKDQTTVHGSQGDSFVLITTDRMVLDESLSEYIKKATHLVIDEADEIITRSKMEFFHELSGALDFTGITLSLFSATINPYVEEVVGLFKDTTRIHISQTLPFRHVFTFGTRDNIKHLLLMQMLDDGVDATCLIFVDDVKVARSLADRIPKSGVYEGVGDTQTLQDFRLKKVWYLFTTDALSRGADFYNVRSVINYDFPKSKTDFVHRCGRVNRVICGQSVYTVYTVDDFSKLWYVAEFLKDNGCQVDEHICRIIESS